MKIVIIGAGVIGLSCAYFLSQTGHTIEIYDQGDMQDGCSYGNAGLIEISQMTPVPAPGIIQKVLPWMFQPNSPFYMKPQCNADFLQWLYYFLRATSHSHAQHCITIYKQLAALSQQLYQQITEQVLSVPLYKKGLMILYKTQKAQEIEQQTAAEAGIHGMTATELNIAEIVQLNPNIRFDILGGIHYLNDMHVNPADFVNGLKEYLQTRDVRFYIKEKLIDIEIKSKKIQKLVTTNQTIEADMFVFATGAWTGQIAKKVKLNIPLQPGKGYHIKLYPKHNIQMPMMLSEKNIAVTPMGSQLRLAGTMELSGFDHQLRQNRVQAIANGVESYFPDLAPIRYSQDQVWCGLRPMPADGLPFIGRTKGLENLCIAAGHGMRGISLGLATGSLIRDMIDEKPIPSVFDGLCPDRFAGRYF